MLLKLSPAVVATHMLVSLGLVAVSTALLVRERSGDGPRRAAVAPWLVRTGQVLVALTVVLLALGVVVTGAGPHGGDDEVAYRFAVDPVMVARLHAGGRLGLRRGTRRAARRAAPDAAHPSAPAARGSCCWRSPSPKV